MPRRSSLASIWDVSLAHDLDNAAVRFDQAIDQAQTRGLAAAARADQRDGFALGHLEVDVAKRRARAEVLGDAAELDRGHGSPRRRGAAQREDQHVLIRQFVPALAQTIATRGHFTSDDFRRELVIVPGADRKFAQPKVDDDDAPARGQVLRQLAKVSRAAADVMVGIDEQHQIDLFRQFGVALGRRAAW